MNEIERMLHAENRHKKMIGSNIHHKTGVRGYVGKMLFPTDLMSRKEKYQTRKAGKVVVYNMYETILTKAEFELKDKEMQKTLLTRWREIYPNKEIISQMGLSGSGVFHKLITELEIPMKSRGGNRKRRSLVKVPAQDEQTPSSDTLLSNEQTETHSVQQTPIKLLQTGLHLEYNGTYDANQLAKIFTKLQLLTDDEDCKFNLSISLTERAE